jgi:hypothetical protein
VAIEIVLVADAELEELARQHGALSNAALLLKRLRDRRAKDYQVYAFRVGENYFVGPVPDARTERELIDLVESDEEE